MRLAILGATRRTGGTCPASHLDAGHTAYPAALQVAKAKLGLAGRGVRHARCMGGAYGFGALI